MGILIENIEMPKDDALSVIIYPDGVAEVQIGWNGDIPVYTNAFKATAIPVPEHGDLIDRDALANSIPEAEPDGFENCSRCTCMTKDEMVDVPKS